MDVHTQLGLLILIETAIGLAFGTWLVLYLGRSHRELVRMTRAVAGLIVQESEKAQRLLGDR
jgi:hypothetical protein